tara:strand:+ start:142 stop:354 length:213 start_codon:yes stop_codon:yes gene_type:complete
VVRLMSIFAILRLVMLANFFQAPLHLTYLFLRRSIQVTAHDYAGGRVMMMPATVALFLKATVQPPRPLRR